MSTTVCLFANTLSYPEGGGHLWVYLNWALGLRSIGCEVVWLESADPAAAREDTDRNVEQLKRHLAPYGLKDKLAVLFRGGPQFGQPTAAHADAAWAADCDLLLAMRYDATPALLDHFPRTALIDIDPGLLQTWLSKGQIELAPHDLYFTTGETVGCPDARFPDAGLPWHYTPPCVSLDWWLVAPDAAEAAFTTVSHWYANEWLEEDGELYWNDKRSGFLPFLDLPSRTSQPLELAIYLGEDEVERRALLERGWRVRQATDVASRPWDYQAYIQASKGEFSCVKPSCVRLQNAWMSDRTLCYLASGKPVVVQHTGFSRLLPQDEGMFRFRTAEEALNFLEAAASDYDRHCRLARQLAEDHFDASKVVTRVLERALA